MKTADYLVNWLELRKPRLAPTTYCSYVDVVNRYLVPYFGTKEVDEITPFDVELFLGGLLGSGLAPSTVKRIYSVFRSSMAKAAKMELIRANPTGAGKIDPLPRHRKEIEVFSPAEVHLLLQALQGEPLRWHCYGRAAIDSGARRGELVGLQWRDIDGTCCHIRRAAYKLPKQPAATKPPKSGKARCVHLTRETAVLLEQLRREQRKACLKSGTAWSSHHFVFGTMGAMLHPTTPTKWWRSFLQRSDLPRRPLHALRHTSATLLLSSGVDIKTVSARLGHSSLEVTQLYLHLIGDADQRAAEVMESIL